MMVQQTTERRSTLNKLVLSMISRNLRNEFHYVVVNRTILRNDTSAIDEEGNVNAGEYPGRVGAVEEVELTAELEVCTMESQDNG